MHPSFDWIIRHKWVVILTLLLTSLLMSAGARHLTFKSDYRVFFGPENPQLQAFERIQNTFAKSDNVLFIVVPKSGTVFEEDSLQAIAALTTEAWQLPYSLRVDSITNFQHIYAEEDDLIVDDLVPDAEALDDTSIARVKRISLNEPRLVNRLVSAEGHVAAVNVTIQLPGKDLVKEVPEVANQARLLRDQMLAEHASIANIYLSGIVMMDATFAESAIADNASLVPLMFLVVVVLIGILARTLFGTLATLIIIIVSITSAMGLAGWAGMYLTGPSASAPTIILTLAVADCVHILSTFGHEMRRGSPKALALLQSLKINMRPILLTSVTTAIGFLSMNFSDSPPFRDLGNIVAVGVMLACVFSLTLFPALLMALPIKPPASIEASDNNIWDKLAGIIITHRKPVFWGCLAVIVITVSQIPRNELNDNFVEYFDTSVPFRVAADFSDSNLTGMSVMEFELESGEEGGISEPEFLARTSNFVDWLRQQPEIIHVDTLSDTLMSLNQNMNAEDPAFYTLPESREMTAQYLLLYEMSLPYGLDINNQININKSAVRIIANGHNLTSNQMLDLEQRCNQWLTANAPNIIATNTSPTLMFAHIGKRNIESMLGGTVIALVLISALLGLALRSVKYGLISLIPNLIPAGIAFGLWGMFVGEVGLALSVVTGMTLGIVVDDTVHFLSKYLYARRQRGEDTEAAIRYAFNTVGSALWITTLVLAAGFMVLAQSSFKVNGDMGLLTATTIIIALVMDFLLLPVLLMHLSKRKQPAQAASS